MSGSIVRAAVLAIMFALTGPALAQTAAAIGVAAPAALSDETPSQARDRLTATTVEARRLVDALSAQPFDRNAVDAALRAYEQAVVAFTEATARERIDVGAFAAEPRKLLDKARAAVRPRRGQEAASRARFIADYNGYLAGARAASLLIGP
jgi:hypothetical protein